MVRLNLVLVLSLFIGLTWSTSARASLRCQDIFHTASEVSVSHQNLSELLSQGSTMLPGLNGTTLIAIDLAKAKRVQDFQMVHVAEGYFNHTLEVYKFRLKKFDFENQQDKTEFALKAAQTDQELSERSIVVVDVSPSADSKWNMQYNAGLRMTFSKNEKEKLPFQYEFSDLKAKSSGVNLEVGRLTATGPDSAQRSAFIIRMALRFSVLFPEIKDVYVHTSRIHVRLYKMMGFTPSEVIVKDDLNYILRFSKDDLQNFLNL